MSCLIPVFVVLAFVPPDDQPLRLNLCVSVCWNQIIRLSPIPPVFVAFCPYLLSETRWTLHSLTANRSSCSALTNVNTDILCPCLIFRWQHTTQRARVTPAKWWSSSQTLTGPAAPVSLSSEEESYPPVSRWPGVRILCFVKQTLWYWIVLTWNSSKSAFE